MAICVWGENFLDNHSKAYPEWRIVCLKPISPWKQPAGGQGVAPIKSQPELETQGFWVEGGGREAPWPRQCWLLVIQKWRLSQETVFFPLQVIATAQKHQGFLERLLHIPDILASVLLTPSQEQLPDGMISLGGVGSSSPRGALSLGCLAALAMPCPFEKELPNLQCFIPKLTGSRQGSCMPGCVCSRHSTWEPRETAYARGVAKVVGFHSQAAEGTLQGLGNCSQ